MRKPLTVFVLAFAIAIFSSCARRDIAYRAPVAAPETPEKLRVGAWNIEWLGNPENRSGPAKNMQQKPEDLADYILAANVSVLGLEEIAEDATAPNPDGGNDIMLNTIIGEALEQIHERTG